MPQNSQLATSQSQNIQKQTTKKKHQKNK